MHHQSVELMDAVQRQPPRGLDAFLGEKGAAWDVETRQVGLQSRCQLREGHFIQVLTGLLFCLGLGDEIDLLKKFQATKAEP